MLFTVFGFLVYRNNKKELFYFDLNYRLHNSYVLAFNLCIRLLVWKILGEGEFHTKQQQ